MAESKIPGGYYIVNGKPVDAYGQPVTSMEDASPAPRPKRGAFESDLAADYPGRAALVKLKMNTADVDALDREGLIALDGIGEVTADEILAARG